MTDQWNAVCSSGRLAAGRLFALDSSRSGFYFTLLFFVGRRAGPFSVSFQPFHCRRVGGRVLVAE